MDTGSLLGITWLILGLLGAIFYIKSELDEFGYLMLLDFLLIPLFILCGFFACIVYLAMKYGDRKFFVKKK